jgi:hypothetical protein
MKFTLKQLPEESRNLKRFDKVSRKAASRDIRRFARL